MSDSPPIETPEKEAPGNGGWHTPTTPGAWQTPETSEEVVGWRVPTLPKDMEEEPDEAGGWHLPKAEDTVYSPEDQIDIRPPEDEPENWQVPQDAVQVTIAPPPEDAVPPEDALVPVSAPRAAPSPEPLAAPEDLMYMLEHLDEAEEEDDSVHMSELIALASLSEDAALFDVIQGEASPFPATVVEGDVDEEDIQTERLSPAERVMLGVAPAAEEPEAPDDPAAYARQQLAQLEGGDTAALEDTSPPSEDATSLAESDPAAYARQQLAQLGITGESPAVDAADPGAYARQQLSQLGAEGDYTPIPEQTEQLNPREIVLAQRYHEAEAQVNQLREQWQSGQLSTEDFQAQIQTHMVHDDDGNWWTLGADRNQWYKLDPITRQWVDETPPVLITEQRQQAQQPTGAAFQAGSLPYLPEEPSPAEYSSSAPTAPHGATGFTPPDEIRLDENYMPLPKQVPLQDPDFTVPNPRVFDAETDPSFAPTVPASSYYDATVPSPAAPQYGTIEAPYDESEPPDYEALEEGELYREAVEKQRRTATSIAIIAAVIGVGLLFLAAAGFIVAALLWYQGIVEDWETQIAALASFEPEFQTVTILDNQGDRIATLSREGDDRRPVSLGEMSPYLLHAAISLENPRFYEDPGWDFFAIMRAFWDNFVAGEITSGGSTITQQVARNLVLQNADLTAERKVNEVIVAGELTRQYTKSEILELYLNEVTFFGNQTYGVEAASQFYFGVPASELTLPQAAMLMAINNAPATNEPVNNRQTAMDLMRAVMDRMAAVGCITFEHNQQTLCIDEQTLQSPQVVRDLALVQARSFQPRDFGVRYPHFVQRVQAELENIFGPTELYRGGYVVTTTLNTAVQDTAQDALADRVRQLSTTGVNTGAIMVTDPRNGAILAMVGSPDFTNEEIDGQVNAALTWQQPGSAIKPVLYTAALRGVDINLNNQADVGEYYTPASILWDVQTTYPGNYTPVNFDRRYRGPIALRYALQNSINVTAIRTYEFVGTEVFRQVAEAMGLNFLAEAEFNLTTAVGSTDVRLYDMMEAYGTLANNGVYNRLYTIVSIADSNGNPIPIPSTTEPTRAVDAQTAFLMQNILSDDQARRDQFGLNSALTINGLPTQNFVAVKTGTSDDSRDLWTMGFTSNRVTGVWLGTVDNQPTFNTTGFTAAAPLWNTVMIAALQGNAPREFVPPQDGSVVTRQICATTGTLPSENCTNIRNEYFAGNRPPPDPSQAFTVTLSIDSWSGLVANEFCPDQAITASFINIQDPAVITWINTTAQGQAYAQTLGLTTPVVPAPQQACTQNYTPPVVRIADPSGGQTVQGNVAITGTVQADNMQRYELQVAPAGTQTYTTITTSTTQQSQPQSPLGNWDTRSVPNGNYTLRLAVFATNGGYLYRTADITVNNPAPTATPPPTTAPTIPQPVDTPLPFDPVPGNTNNGTGDFNNTVPQGPTPTVDPLGG